MMTVPEVVGLVRVPAAGYHQAVGSAAVVTEQVSYNNNPKNQQNLIKYRIILTFKYTGR